MNSLTLSPPDLRFATMLERSTNCTARLRIVDAQSGSAELRDASNRNRIRLRLVRLTGNQLTARECAHEARLSGPEPRGTEPCPADRDAQDLAYGCARLGVRA